MEITIFSWLMGSQRAQIDVTPLIAGEADVTLDRQIKGVEKEICTLEKRITQLQRPAALARGQSALQAWRAKREKLSLFSAVCRVLRRNSDALFAFAFTGDLRSTVLGTWDDLPLVPPRIEVIDSAKLIAPVAIIGFDHAANHGTIHWCCVATLEDGWVLAAHAIIQFIGPSYSFIAALDTQSTSWPSPVVQWPEIRELLTADEEAA